MVKIEQVKQNYNHQDKLHPKFHADWMSLTLLQKGVIRFFYLDNNLNDDIPTIEQAAETLKTTVGRIRNARQRALTKLSHNLRFESEAFIYQQETYDPFQVDQMNEAED